MPTSKKQPAKKSNPRGARGYKVPPPLRFESYSDAMAYVKANQLSITEEITHRRGHRIQTVNDKGKARTLSIEAIHAK